MRASATVVAMGLLFAFAWATVGVCAVDDEVVILGGEDEKPVSNAPDYAPDAADIKIDGVLFMRLRTPAIGYSVAERESIILKRLVEAMSNCVIAPVHVADVRGRPTVYVGQYRIVTVYPADVAAAGGPDAGQIAEQWADGIRKGLLATAPSRCFSTAPFYSVAIGSQVLFRLFDPYVYDSLRERGEVVDRRLAAIATSFDPALLSTVPVRGGGVSVTYDGQTLVTATPADARARSMCCPQALANAWAKNLTALMPLVTQGQVAQAVAGCAAN